MFCHIINVSTITFDQFNAPLLNKITNFFKKNNHTDLKFAWNQNWYYHSGISPSSQFQMDIHNQIHPDIVEQFHPEINHWNILHYGIKWVENNIHKNSHK